MHAINVSRRHGHTRECLSCPRHALSIIRTRGNVHTAIAPQFFIGICTGLFQRFVFVQNEPGTSSFPLLSFALNEPGTFHLFFCSE